MKKLLALSALVSLAACGGGSGAGSAPGIPAPQSSPASNLVTPHFTIVVPAKTSNVKTARSRNFVSPSTASLVIALTSVNGSSSNLPTPSSAETDINSSTCATSCTVNGPASPPGVADIYSFTLYDATGGTGNVLGTGTATLTPTAGQNNTTSVTIKGVVASITLSSPAALTADTQSQSESLTFTAKDAGANTITGTYANPITISDPDTASYGTSLTGTHTATCTGSCVTLTANSDTVTLNYGGLAENAVTITPSASGVLATNAPAVTFTPTLNAITADAADGTSTYTPCAGTCYGADLFTTDSSASVGYSATLSYKELGFTDSPYNKQLSLTSTGGCSTIATFSTLANASNETPFKVMAAASPTAGHCTATVTDGLTDQISTLPTFVVTYTTSSFSGSARPRHSGTP